MTAVLLGFLLVINPGHVRGSGAVQAAEFLGCKEAEEDVLNHLCTLLMETLKRSEESFAFQSVSSHSDGLLEVNHAYGRDWHNMQV
jgi:hypothetical protein